MANNIIQIVVFIVFVKHLPNFHCATSTPPPPTKISLPNIGSYPAQDHPNVPANHLALHEDHRSRASTKPSKLFIGQRVQPCPVVCKHSSKDHAHSQTTISKQILIRRNLTLDSNQSENKVQQQSVEDPLQTNASSQTSYQHLQFKAPAGMELVVDPVAMPTIQANNHQYMQSMSGSRNQLTNRDYLQQSTNASHLRLPQGSLGRTITRLNVPQNLSSTVNDERTAANWLPINRSQELTTGVSLPQLVFNQFKPYPDSIQTIGQLQPPLGKQYIRLSDLAPFQTGNKQMRFTSNPLPKNAHLQRMAQNVQNYPMQNQKDLQASAHTPDIQLANPAISRYFLQQLMAAAADNQLESAASLVLNANHLGAGAPFYAKVASIRGPEVPLGIGNDQTLYKSTDRWVLGRDKPAAKSDQIRSPDIGEDGNSIVSYSLMPGDGVHLDDPAILLHHQKQLIQQQLYQQQQQQQDEQIQAQGEPSNIPPGLTQDQLISLMQQSGANNLKTLVQQPSYDQATQESNNVQPVDSAVASLFETILKGAISLPNQIQKPNSAQQALAQQPQSQSQQQQSHAQSPQPPTKIVENEQNPPQGLMNAIRNVSTIVDPASTRQQKPPSSNYFLQAQQQPQTTAMVSSLHHYPPPQTTTTMGDQASATVLYPQDSLMDPAVMYSTDPRPRRPKKKRKKEKSDGSKNPVIRVQKRPRQQFYEHNSPNDLQSSATLHKWKYPWLYRPPYDDDDDEEEGETEINLRFFNNFSRMGPLGGIARSAAPATFIISLAFLILSNISLAATVIVHGVSSFLRNLNAFQQQQHQTTSPNSHKITGRLARILFADGLATTRSPVGKFSPGSTSSLTNTTTTQPHRSGSLFTCELGHSKAMKYDRAIRSFASKWI